MARREAAGTRSWFTCLFRTRIANSVFGVASKHSCPASISPEKPGRRASLYERLKMCRPRLHGVLQCRLPPALFARDSVHLECRLAVQLLYRSLQSPEQGHDRAFCKLSDGGSPSRQVGGAVEDLHYRTIRSLLGDIRGNGQNRTGTKLIDADGRPRGGTQRSSRFHDHSQPAGVAPFSLHSQLFCIARPAQEDAYRYFLIEACQRE